MQRTLRFAHRLTNTPITQLDIDLSNRPTIRDLKNLVEENLASEDSCLMRVYHRWYVESTVNGLKKLVSIDECCNEDEEVAFEDYTTIYLEGPLTTDYEGVGQAVAVVNVRLSQSQSQQKAHHLMVMSSLEKVLENQERILIAITNGQKHIQSDVDRNRTLLQGVMSTLNSTSSLSMAAEGRAVIVSDEPACRRSLEAEEDLCYTELITEFSTGERVFRERDGAIIAGYVNRYLQEFPGMPAKSFWASLQVRNLPLGPSIPVAIVKTYADDVDWRSTVSDGTFKTSSRLVIGSGSTPLILATSADRCDVVKLLVTMGADVSVRNDDGDFPLFIASANSNIEILQLLLSKGANVNDATPYGNTALHWAAANGSLPIVALLINKGADLQAVNDDGQTPLDRLPKSCVDYEQLTALLTSSEGRYPLK